MAEQPEPMLGPVPSEPTGPGRIKGFVKWVWSEPVPFVANEPRDHLANERTFLAWFRTGLSCAGLGILIARGVHTPTFLTAGLLMIAMGLLYIVYGGFRYYRVLVLLDQKLFAASRLGIAFFFAFSLAICLLIAVLIGTTS